MMESKLVGWVEPAIPIITICVDDGFRRRLNPSYKVHARLRVQRAPGVPHALFGREIHQRLGRMARRGRERTSGFFVIASAAKQSILSLRGQMDCFASLAMTERVARECADPLARNDAIMR